MVIAYQPNCMIGLHRRMSPSFMITRHARCLVDGMFWLVKQRCPVIVLTPCLTWRTLLVAAPRPMSLSMSTPADVPWYKWESYLNVYFHPIPGVSQQQNFSFGQVTLEIVRTQQLADS